MSDASHAVDSLLDTLYLLWLPRAMAPSDPDVSREILMALMPLIPASHDWAAYAEQVDQKWPHLLHTYGPDRQIYLLAGQPEGLVIGYLLDQDPVRILQHWRTHFALRPLARFAAIWGRPLPESEESWE